MNPDLKALISEAQGITSMIRSDLDDLAHERKPPDGENGLLTAARRAGELRSVLTEIERFARSRGLSLRPKGDYILCKRPDSTHA